MMTALTFALWAYFLEEKELSAGQAVITIFIVIISVLVATTQDLSLIRYLNQS